MSRQKILFFTIISLPVSKVLFHYQRPFLQQENYRNTVISLIPAIAPYAIENEKAFILKQNNEVFLYCKANIFKNVFIIAFQGEFLINSIEKLMEEYEQMGVLEINYREKRYFEEKLEFLAQCLEGKEPEFNRINEEINEINEKMKKNINKIVIHQENLEVVNKKAEKMSEMAEKFKGDAVEYRKKQENHYWFWALLGILLIIIIIVLMVIIVYYEDDDNSVDVGSSQGQIMSNTTLIYKDNFIHFKKIEHN